ncbi:3-phosphoshikimate 1-carboxyvinyltransferase [Peloplasma aerotolerans]|uniref:3-phosphoshikimate 1-carboxyvinyltransferase n=1 Tax=Peloplasma aerotolerans TaxID=3044389 RepID=A0AAW6U3Y0_9MOLU|nr:3-phosphoshikimate 1-carboxyvinyltransferase [Mariniplasma sp. M4Ah]MDI6452676.1 3-phosphoshikimate 1-carboxyvinyltransferase [Mariniplasma sp. M4Ah]
MNITITPKKLSGEVSVVSSKSLSHRYLIAAGLSKGTSVIENILDSDDLDATKEALKSLGVIIDGNQITGGNLKTVKDTIDAKESGSTLRFMIPIAMLLRDKITFTGQGRLPKRPLDVYFDIFKQKHCYYNQLTTDYLPLEVKGQLKPGFYQVQGDISSQFLTGLLFALPLLKKDSVIELITPLESKGYIDLTMDVLKSFGIQIVHIDEFIYIKGSQSYLPQSVTVEGDYSQAAFWMVAGLIGNHIELFNLALDSKQGDKKIIDIIKEMNGNITYKSLSKSYVVEPSLTKGATIDLMHVPDLGPILMVLAALSEGTTKFINTSRLRIKESDRLQAMYEVLIKFDVDMEILGDEAIIHGKKILKGHQSFDSYGDHRITMAIAIAAIKADGPVTILNAGVVNKSYPEFFKVYQSLGGAIHES